MSRKKAYTHDGDSLYRINEDRRHILNDDTFFSTKEAYRSIAANLMYLPIEDRCKKLAVTSANQGEGKTLSCVNLSIALAQIDKRVLLIDGDMRRPRIADLLHISGENGLSEFLAGIDSRPNILKCDVRNLHFLCSGRIPPNPTELLSSHRFEKLLEMVEEYYDFIILDTPPLGIVTDSSIISKFISGYLLSVRVDYSNTDSIEQVVASLERINADIFGFLINGTHPKRSARYGYKSYGNDSQISEIGR